MKRIGILLVALLLTICTAAFTAFAGGEESQDVRYSADKKLLRPENYREWIYLSSGLGMNYGPVGARNGNPAPPSFTNVFVNPSSYREFMKTGKWPDKTIFALEIYSSSTVSKPNRQGNFQDGFLALEAEVKDSSTPDGWTYYGFGTEAKEAAAIPKESCFTCHEENAAVEHSFTQFYPQLLEVALAKGTIKPGVNIPLNANRFVKLIESHGWESAQKAYMQQKKENGGDPISEGALNMVGYGLIQAKKAETAVQILGLAASEHPTSANAYDSLADAYVAAGKKAEAITATRKAIALAATDPALTGQARENVKKAGQDRLKQLAADQKTTSSPSKAQPDYKP